MQIVFQSKKQFWPLIQIKRPWQNRGNSKETENQTEKKSNNITHIEEIGTFLMKSVVSRNDFRWESFTFFLYVVYVLWIVIRLQLISLKIMTNKNKEKFQGSHEIK